MGDFKKLEVWQIAHEVAREIYKETASFPRTELYGGQVYSYPPLRSSFANPVDVAQLTESFGDARILLRHSAKRTAHNDLVEMFAMLT